MYRIATPIAPARTSRIGPTPRTGASSRAALRRGVASLFAMLYLLVFSTLAIGFYSAVTLSVQVAHNDERGLGAQAAAEAGLEFLRDLLLRVRVPRNTEPDRIVSERVTDLSIQTLNTPNLQGRSITVDYDNRIIYFPGSDNGYMIPLDDRGSRFRATIQDAGNRTITKTLEDGRVQRRTVRAMRVRVLGRYKGEKIARAIEMEIWGHYNTLSVFDIGVATRGPITLTGQGGDSGPNTHDGSVLTTCDGNTPVTITGHTINAAFNSCSRAKGEDNPNKEDLEKVTAKAKLVEAAKAVQTYCDAVFAAQTDASLAETVAMGQNQVPRAQLLIGVVSHNMNEYGQKVILMRLKGVTPPSTERAQAPRKPGSE